MFRRLMPFVLIALFFLVDTAVIPAIGSFPLMPVMTLALIHCLGLLLGRSRGLLYGMTAGLLVDITVSSPLGLMTVIYALTGYAGGMFGYYMRRIRIAPLLSAAISFSVYELAMDLYLIFSAMRYDGSLFLRSLGRVAIYIGLVYLMLFPLRGLLKPNMSRFAKK